MLSILFHTPLQPAHNLTLTILRELRFPNRELGFKPSNFPRKIAESRDQRRGPSGEKTFPKRENSASQKSDV